MPLPIHTEYKPPKSWEEFEDLCADLYALIWKDPETQKHGRQGQSQGGVDIYGKRVGKKYRGVQCKKKKSWPPIKITTTEIDDEVKKAKTWEPGLKHFIIATTADNDEKIQLHARKITAKHKAKGLFSVEVVSWEKITRQLTNYKHLLIKYGYLPDIADTVKLAVTETIRQTASQGKSTELAAEGTSGVGDALERDLAARYERAMRRSFFSEALQGNEFASVAEIAREPAYSTTSSKLRRSIFLRAARNEAVRGSPEKGAEYLNVAQRLEGSESDVLARARIVERSDVDAALALIRDIKEPDAQSTVMNMLVRHRSADDALKWFAENKIGIGDLTINGVQTLITAYTQSQDLEALRPILEGLTARQLSDAPYLRFVRAMVNVASILPIPDRQLAVGAFQMDARRGTRSVLNPAKSAARLDRAISDLNALIPLTAELQLPNAKRSAEAYLRWCELLHPHKKAAALTQLREEVIDPALAPDRLALAFAFDRRNFKPDAIEDYLRKREELGGLDDDDLKAALIIRIHSEDPASVAALIAKYRARFEETYKDPPIFTIELQALALAKETSSARLLLEKHKSDLTSDGFAMFESLIAKSEGQDPVAEDLRVYKATKNTDALRALVGSLVDRKDHRATAKYAEELFKQSSDSRDLAVAAYALAQLGDGTEFVRMIEAYPFLEEGDPEFRRHYAWELFRRGRLGEAKERADLLIKDSPPHRDLQLEIAIAIESGEWESLAKPLAAFLDDVSKYTGLELIRAAHIAQQSSQGPILDLLKAAIAKADNNPHVWLGAYSLVIEEGLAATIAFAKTGAATVKIGATNFMYGFAGLLSSTPAKRLKFLNGYLKDFTVSTSQAASLRANVRKTKFSEDDFLSVVSNLQFSHEMFVRNLRSTAKSRDLNSGDLLPADLDYWNNLFAPLDASDSLSDFLANERQRELNSLLTGHIARALHATSLSFCGPSLVPIDSFKKLPKDDLLNALETLTTLPDHFGLTGFFEICATLNLDERVEALGTKLLDALFDMESLESRCTFYSAVFAMTLARLAEHTTLRNKPAFWRRITAAANASLVLRACGSDNAKGVFEFVMRNYGKTFLLSVLLETDREPRWRADWVTSNHLIADAVGRAEQAVKKIPEARIPKDWTERLAAARKWVSDRHLEFYSVIPAIGESARRKPPTKREISPFKPLYDAFASDPTVNGLLACGGGIFTIGATPDLVRACRTLIDRFQISDVKWTDENVQYTIQMLSFVAVLNRDTKLADLIADYCVGKIRDNQDNDATLEIVARLIECACADINRIQASKGLARRLEGIAFLAPAKALPDFCDSIMRLQALDAELAPQLARALSASRLGVNAA